MISLVHDSHVWKLLLQVGIPTQTVGGSCCEGLKAFKIFPIGNPKGGYAFSVRNVE